MTTENYWTGPYGVLVPEYIDEIIAKDGYNLRYKDGSVTEKFMPNPNPMNEDIYRRTYATCVNGKWYYKEKPKPSQKNDRIITVDGETVMYESPTH